MRAAEVPLRSVEVRCFTVPTDRPESDGTFAWDRTTIVVAEVSAGGHRGLGYTYTDAAAGELIRSVLWPAIEGTDALDIPMAFGAMQRAVRNVGSRGLAATAISALDVALWDLKARLMGMSVVALLGRARSSVPVYGSGGFTSYPDAVLCDQLSGWVEDGIASVKMKVGRKPEDDPHRVRAARAAVGDRAKLFVDANGAYARKQALALAERLAAEAQISWFEEPVSSDDLGGLRLLRDRAPAGVEVAAGEYGYDTDYFARMAAAGAVDVLQVDATRAGGYTGLLAAAAVAEAAGLEISGHCAPTLHAPALAAVRNLRHLEYFHDHVRIEELLFDGYTPQRDGALWPDPSVEGLGLSLRRADAEQFAL
jgi:L-alanine-DL-glutamate epimerase-like enolase superfamily enzyme